MNSEILKMVSDLLNVPIDEVELHSKQVSEANATYFWSPKRGGNAVIVSSTGERLAATSAVSFEQHVKAFLAGKRN